MLGKHLTGKRVGDRMKKRRNATEQGMRKEEVGDARESRQGVDLKRYNDKGLDSNVRVKST